MPDRQITDNSKYKFLLGWARKLDPGEAFLATQDKEFTCEVQSFAGIVYAAATQQGLKATVMTFPDLGAVVFAFYSGADYMKPNLPAYPIVKKMLKF